MEFSTGKKVIALSSLSLAARTLGCSSCLTQIFVIFGMKNKQPRIPSDPRFECKTENPGGGTQGERDN